MQWEVEPTGARIAQLATDLTARIDALDPESDTPVYSDFTFSIAVADWTLANGVYTARVNNTVLLTENAGIQVFYDASLRTGLVGDIFADKHTGYIDFTTTLQPVGAISGIVRVLDSVSGMLSVAKGGTGAATPKKARENLNAPIRDIPVDFGTVSSLPQTIYDADITANMVAFDATFSNPAAVPDGIDVTFAAGSVTITGTITSGQETTIKFWCHEKRTAVEGTESGSAEPRVNEFVHVGAQTLTAEQQTQIRTNLGAASAEDITALNSKITNSLKSGENFIWNIIACGYNTGSGNYFDFFVPCSTGGKTVTSASIADDSIVYLPTNVASFPSTPNVTVIGQTDYGVRLEVKYPSTNTPNICGTIYAINVKLTCS